MQLGFLIAGPIGALLCFVLSTGMNILAYWKSDEMVLRLYAAEEVYPDKYPNLFRRVERLAQKAEIPMPKLYIMHNMQPNAFATGRSPEKGAVALTTGLMEQLTFDEVDAVVAHELAHVKNRDTLIMTIAAVVVGAISMLSNIGFFFGGARGDQRVHPALLIVMLIVAPLAAVLIQMAISRTREYEADRIGSDICGQPLMLASALRKISENAGRIDNRSAEDNPATAHMFIINPLHARFVDNFFSTHPKTENRIEALKKIAKDMEIKRKNLSA